MLVLCAKFDKSFADTFQVVIRVFVKRNGKEVTIILLSVNDTADVSRWQSADMHLALGDMSGTFDNLVFIISDLSDR